MSRARKLVVILAFVATFFSLAAAASRCPSDRWLADPGISPAVLDANGYRVVTRQTLTLADGRQAIDTRSIRGTRVVKCRLVYDETGTEVESTCYLPCRDG